MKISVCIGSVRSNTLEATVNSIRRQTWADWELNIVGQGSNTDLQSLGKKLSGSDSRIHYFHLTQMGVSTARNAAIEAATGDIVAFTDDDCEANPDWLEVIAEYFEKEPELGVVGGNLVKPKISDKLFSYCPQVIVSEVLYDPIANDPIPSNRKAPDGWDLVGANLAIRTEIFKALGPFDPCLGAGSSFPAAEDTDYKLRLEAAGVKMRTTPRSLIFHTYGYRYGIKASIKHRRNYAEGDGAVAAKLLLQGDKRGYEWPKALRQDWQTTWWKQHRPQFLITKGWYFLSFIRAYRYCLSKYKLDSTGRVLEKKA